MSTIKVDTVKSSVAGVAPVISDLNGVEVSQGATAWVNFDGTGVVAIRDSFNVSSITDLAVGNYQINYAATMANANFAVQISTNRPSANTTLEPVMKIDDVSAAPSTTQVRILVGVTTSGGQTFQAEDMSRLAVTIHGGK